MKDYSLLQSIFGGVFASDLGRSDQETEALFKEMLEDAMSKQQIEKVLLEAFSDPEFSWQRAFEQYEVYPADDEVDAREYATKILWNVVFPGQKPPAP